MSDIVSFESDDQPAAATVQFSTSTDNLSPFFTDKEMDERPTPEDCLVVRQVARITMQRMIA